MSASTFRIAPIPQQIPGRGTLFFVSPRGLGVLRQIALDAQRVALNDAGRHRSRHRVAQKKTPTWTSCGARERRRSHPGDNVQFFPFHSKHPPVVGGSARGDHARAPQSAMRRHVRRRRGVRRMPPIIPHRASTVAGPKPQRSRGGDCRGGKGRAPSRVVGPARSRRGSPLAPLSRERPSRRRCMRSLAVSAPAG